MLAWVPELLFLCSSSDCNLFKFSLRKSLSVVLHYFTLRHLIILEALNTICHVEPRLSSRGLWFTHWNVSELWMLISKTFKVCESCGPWIGHGLGHGRHEFYSQFCLWVVMAKWLLFYAWFSFVSFAYLFWRLFRVWTVLDQFSTF